MASLEDQPRITSFLPADHAEAINGKLYVMGGGFDTLWAPQFPHDARFYFGAVLTVPWNDTNRRFPIEATAVTIDGDDLGWKMGGEIEAGRAPGKRGGDAIVVMAGPVVFRAEEPVEFTLTLRFASDERSVRLSLQAPPFPIMPPGMQAPTPREED
jgi:hypothetical protein